MRKHKVGDLVYCKTFGLGVITKACEKKYATKPYFVEWVNPLPDYLKNLEYYNEYGILIMKDYLKDFLNEE